MDVLDLQRLRMYSLRIHDLSLLQVSALIMGLEICCQHI